MECYELVTPASEGSCLKECDGMYSVVDVDINYRNLALNGIRVTPKFETFCKEYLQYKRAYEAEFDNIYEHFRPYESKMGWPFINEQAVVVPTLVDSFGGITESEVEQRLEVVNIYFNAPTFDQVTRDARTNFVTKMSMIGGTLGLFTGFSVISGIQILYFAIILALKVYKG